LAREPDRRHSLFPADRIIVASARIMGASLLTGDSRIRDADLVQTI
jgi:hypothetical protein